MNNTLFLQHCDPRQNYNEKQIQSILNLYALISKEIVIQDNFLVSKLFYDLSKLSINQSFQILFSEKILNIASRDNLDYSILNLKNELQKKAIEGLYMPFEGLSGIELYQQIDFENYIKKLDKNLLSQRKNFKSWSPDELGRDLRNLMLKSAENGTSGLNPEIAINVVKSIDRIAIEKFNELKHDRSMYFDYKEKLNDRQLSDKIWKWINLIYTRNLPDKLSIGLSLSGKTLIDDYSYDPFMFAKNKELFNKSNVFGSINAVIFSPEFLINLHPKSILDIRKFDEFENLQKALNGNDEKEKIASLTNYFTRLSNEAPKFYEPFRKKIRNLESLKKIKLNLTTVFDVFAIAAMFSPEPYYRATIVGLSFLLRKNKTIESKIEKTIQSSNKELYKIKLENEIKNLGDVCHQLEGNI